MPPKSPPTACWGLAPVGFPIAVLWGGGGGVPRPWGWNGVVSQAPWGGTGWRSTRPFIFTLGLRKLRLLSENVNTPQVTNSEIGSTNKCPFTRFFSDPVVASEAKYDRSTVCHAAAQSRSKAPACHDRDASIGARGGASVGRRPRLFHFLVRRPCLPEQYHKSGMLLSDVVFSMWGAFSDASPHALDPCRSNLVERQHHAT